MNPQFASPDLIVFFFGLFLTAALFARGVRGAIVWGILGATVLAVALQARRSRTCPRRSLSPRWSPSRSWSRRSPSTPEIVSAPPSLAPTFLKMDLVNALSWSMMPFILIFLFMDVFDTLGTLIGVSERAGLIKDGQLPRAKEAMMSDAIGTAVGAALGTSTVTSFIESAAGVEQGGRTGLTALVVAVLFLVALFFSPLIAMVGNYPPITAPALVVVGSMMMRNVTKIDWDNYAEAMPSFLVIDRHSVHLLDRRRAGPGVHRLSGRQARRRPGPRRQGPDVPLGRRDGGVFRVRAGAGGVSLGIRDWGLRTGD